MGAMIKDVLCLVDSPDKYAGVRKDLGVVSRYVRFGLFSGYQLGEETETDKRCIVVVKNDDSDPISEINHHEAEVWILAGSQMSSTERRRFRALGYTYVIERKELRKTVRRILSSKEKDDSKMIAKLQQNGQSNAFVEQLLENYAEVYAEFSRDGIIFDVSASVMKILGLEKQALKGSSYIQLGITEAFWKKMLNSIEQAGYFTSQTTLCVGSSRYSCTVYADKQFRVQKPEAEFYIVLKSVQSLQQDDLSISVVSQPQEERYTELPIIKVGHDVVIAFNAAAERILHPIRKGDSWTSILNGKTASCDEYGIRNLFPGLRFVCIADPSGEQGYYHVSEFNSGDELHPEKTVVLVDSSAFISGLSAKIRSMFSEGEQQKLAVSDKIRDDIGALLSIGRSTIEGITRQSYDPVQSAQTHQSMLEVLERVYARLKQLAGDVFPPTIKQFGLGAAIKRMVNAGKNNSGLHCLVEVKPTNLRTDADTELQIFRMTEAAFQSAQHAGLKRMEVSIIGQRDEIMFAMTFNDDAPVDGWAKVEENLIRALEIRIFACNGKINMHRKGNIINFEIRIPIK